MGGRLWGIAVIACAAGGCLSPDVVVCADDRVCPAGTVCHETLGCVWQEFEGEVKAALYQLCIEEKQFDGEALPRLFTQKVANVRSQLSGLRTPTNKGDQ